MGTAPCTVLNKGRLDIDRLRTELASLPLPRAAHGCLALIRRQREAGLQHSLLGGVVEVQDGEDPVDALRREGP